MADDELRQLVEAARGGDRQAFEALYARFERGVYGLCFRLLGHADQAADAAQQVWVDLYEHLGRLRHPEAFVNWWRQAALRTCRRRQRRWFGWRGFAPDEEEAQPDRAPAPGEALARDELSERVQAALDRLSAPHREVVVLHHFEELPLAEIAELLGVAPGTVKSRLGRAREHLGRLLAPYLEE